MQRKIKSKKSVIKDLKKIDRNNRLRIINRIKEELLNNPYKGKKLTGEFEGLYSLRVGDYRVIYTILRDDILVLRISYRKDVSNY